MKLLCDKSMTFRLEALVNEKGMHRRKKFPRSPSIWRLGRDIKIFIGTSPLTPGPSREIGGSGAKRKMGP